MFQEVILSSSSKEDLINILDAESYHTLFQFKDSFIPTHGVSLMNNKNIDYFSSLSSGFVALQSNRTAVNLYKWGKAQPVFKCNLSEKFTACCTTQDGVYLFLGSISGKIYVYSLFTGELLQSFEAHYKSVTCLKYMNETGLLFSGGADGLLRCWSLADIFTPQGISYNNQNDSTHSNNISPLFSASEHSLTITDIFIGSTTNSYIITSSLDMTIKIWDPFTFRCIFSYTLPSAVNCICASSSQTLLYIGCSNNMIYILNLSNCNINSIGYAYKTVNIQNHELTSNEDPIITPLKGHKFPITTITINYDGSKVVSGDTNGDLFIWDTINMKLIKSVHLFTSAITNLQFIIKPTNLLQGGEPLYPIVPLKKYPISNLLSFNPSVILPSSSSIPSDIQALSKSKEDTSTVRFNKTYEEQIEQLQQQVQQLQQANEKWQDVAEQLYKKCLSYE